MTSNQNHRAEPGDGERLHQQRRRNYWLLVGLLGLIGAAAGFVYGFIEGSGAGDDGLRATLGTIGIVAVAIAAALGSWLYFARVDEVELADNLWGSLIGFYTYAILFPAWWALHQLGQAGEPHDWAIFGAAMVTATLAYVFRKWRSR